MTFIIAEVGVNHNGDVNTALKLLEKAVETKSDAVKFQMFSSRELWGDDRIVHLELKPADYERIKRDCDVYGIEFMCTPFGVQELEFLAPMLKRIKIASGCIAKDDLLKAAAATKLPIILSTGMSTYDDIRNALTVIGPHDVTLLHCTSAYPCPLDQVNLRAMQAMRVLGCPVGYSDHTAHIVIPCYAVAAGAVMIEAHITLDSSQEGPDHSSSFMPNHFTGMVHHIRKLDSIMGTNEKVVQPAEAECHKAWRT